jgi:hypothetical protein
MIGVLDPKLFEWGTPTNPLTSAEEESFIRIIGDVVRTTREFGVELLTTGEYWLRLWADFVTPLVARLCTPEGRGVVAELRKVGGRRTTYPAAPPATRVWGFRTMFGTGALPTGWEDRMADAVSRGVAAGHTVVLFTRLVRGRNLFVHTGKQHVRIDEVTRWRLYVRTPGAPQHVGIDCIRNAHQLRRRWTIRIDPRLPTSEDGARYPYCLPPDWYRGRCVVVATKLSAPAWVDAQGRGWTRPNIPNGKGYHWDVFFSDPALTASIGVDQLNIVEVGAPKAEGTPGSLHHVPTTKASKVTDKGWNCG